MKKTFLIFAVCLSTLFLLSCGSDNGSEEIKTKVQEVDDICPALIWDGWIFQSVDYEGNQVTFTIKDEYELNDEMLEASHTELKKAAKWWVEEFSEAYAYARVDDVEGDSELYTRVFPLIKAMVDNGTGLKIKWVDSDGNKVSATLSSYEVQKAAML